MKLSIGSMGGTISMTPIDSGNGVVPKLGAKDFIASLPDVGIELHAESLFALPSGHLRFEMLLKALAWAKKQVKDGACGVILTQGTDTLEESAFLLDLFWDREEPLILMGAMRDAQAIGADGIRNLYASIVCAKSPNSRSRGVMVVMNDTIHSPRWVRKSHSLAVDTFCSDGKTYGFIAEGKVEYFCPPLRRMVLETPPAMKKVFLWEQTLDGDVSVLEWVKQTQDGLVIKGFGAGHISLEACKLIDSVIEKIPVIICTRTTDGPTAYETYGYEGAEIDLIKRGALMGGHLSGRKARLLLSAVLGAGGDMRIVQDYLDILVY
ncbi:asparaginase [Helicobacter sp. 11S02596-1]|uniref:asparaginase n=1 Tax=Helicobacter sp. 11S02596-1 TaxID=1476194 RepID=UPI000BA5F30A|nr:asparaginase [Helicobacter sp. 11S02596-1]PAF43232.1 hypothetical protein BJI48_05685 [Helicobacter sp. 11S02596-1]